MEVHHWDGNRQNNRIQTWVFSTPTVTIKHTVNGTNDKAPRTEEPRDRETITRGSVVAAGRETSPLTPSAWVCETPNDCGERRNEHDTAKQCD
jgi:hypothetical protein